MGGTTIARTGEPVTVYVSESVTDPDGTRQRWADFFAGLVHGSELALLTAYIVPVAEVAAICGSPDALGCYGSGQLVIPSEPDQGVPPEEVARHEYGHHVAGNRLNTPWSAIDWGAKRWASAASVCARAADGTAFPGDEDAHYRLNPGEAFAEVYRLLNDAKASATGVGWPVVDGSFYPDQAALAAAEQDVVAPWSVPTTRTYRVVFKTGATKLWTLSLATPLDGELRVTLSLPRLRLYRLTVLSADGKTELARGLWSGTTSQTASVVVCGQRSLFVQVTGDGRAGRFALTTSLP